MQPGEQLLQNTLDVWKGPSMIITGDDDPTVPTQVRRSPDFPLSEASNQPRHVPHAIAWLSLGARLSSAFLCQVAGFASTATNKTLVVSSLCHGSGDRPHYVYACFFLYMSLFDCRSDRASRC